MPVITRRKVLSMSNKTRTALEQQDLLFAKERVDIASSLDLLQIVCFVFFFPEIIFFNVEMLQIN